MARIINNKICKFMKLSLICGVIICFSKESVLFGENSKEVLNIIKSVEDTMSKVNLLSADFVQTRKMELLNYDLKLCGSIYLQKPDAFAWHTKSPLISSTIVKDGVFKQWDQDSGETLQFDVEDNPAFQIIWKQMSAWFSGEYTSFVKDYNIKVLSRKPLSLQFHPKKGIPAYKMIKYVQVDFSLETTYIKRLLIFEKQGDTSDIQFENIKINSQLDEKVWDEKLNATD